MNNGMLFFLAVLGIELNFYFFLERKELEIVNRIYAALFGWDSKKINIINTFLFCVLMVMMCFVVQCWPRMMGLDEEPGPGH